jgi:hypothetical protein
MIDDADHYFGYDDGDELLDTAVLHGDQRECLQLQLQADRQHIRERHVHPPSQPGVQHLCQVISTPGSIHGLVFSSWTSSHLQRDKFYFFLPTNG